MQYLLVKGLEHFTATVKDGLTDEDLILSQVAEVINSEGEVVETFEAESISDVDFHAKGYTVVGQ